MMDQAREARRLRGPLVAAVAVTGVFCAWLGFRVGGDTAVLYVDDLTTAVAALTATVLCARAAARHAGRMRLFWSLFAAASGAWALGEAIWFVYDVVLRQDVPVPSWADLGYLTAIPLAVVALLFHPAMRDGGARKARTVLDGLVIATALLFVSWTLVAGPLWGSTDLTTLSGVVALAYPFGDVVIVFLIVLVVRGMTRGDRRSLWLVLGGLLAMSLSDSVYAYLTGVKGYETGELLDTGWVVGYLGIALGAACADPRRVVARRAESSSPTLAPVVAPFMTILVALGTISLEIHLGNRPDRAALMMAFALVALVLVRQALFVWDLIAPTEERDTTLVERVQGAVLGDRSPS